MKKLLLVALLLCGCAFAASAQVKVYCKVIEQTSAKKNKVAIDFGKESGVYNALGLVKNKEKALKFTSGIEALNFMTQSGWSFVQAYVTVTGSIEESEGSTVSTCHYLMYKEFDSAAAAENEIANKFVINKQFKD